MPKKNDDKVGSSEGPITGGGHQTPEQAALVQQGGGGVTDAERNQDWQETAGGKAGRAPVAVGGSSQGQADRMPTGGAARTNGRASNPAVTPGHKHSTS